MDSPSDSPRRDASNGSEASSTSGWRLPLLLGIVLVALVAFRSAIGPRTTDSPRERSATTAERASEVRKLLDSSGTVAPATKSVVLAFDFGDGADPVDQRLAWRQGMTIADAMESSGEVYSFRGDGASAFLTAIRDSVNQGATGRNWIYSVNSHTGDRSFATYELRPGDRVLWTFAPAE